MTNDFIETLLRADDKFVFLVGSDVIRRALPDTRLFDTLVESICAGLDGDYERAELEVATLYLRRGSNAAPLVEVLEILNGLSNASYADARLRMYCDVTRGQLLHLLGSDYSKAKVVIESVVGQARHTSEHLAYAIACKELGDVCTLLGDERLAEESYENALGTFRRYEQPLMAAFVVCNLGILRKHRGEYSSSRQSFRIAREYFKGHHLPMPWLLAENNLGLVAARQGDWKEAEKWFKSARGILEELRATPFWVEMRSYCATPLEHLWLMRRLFADAETGLKEILNEHAAEASPKVVVALAQEFLGELYTELEDWPAATHHLDNARMVALEVLPDSDVMTEVLRRQAQLQLATGELATARETALRCIRLCRKISDRYEQGAAVRVLGEVYVAQKKPAQAAACFRSAVRTLKGIHECYELMRTLYAQGRLLASLKQRAEAEISLLEARQLSKKLELDYYQALIAVALVDTLGPQERFEEAQSWLQEATTLRDGLEGTDRERVETEVSRSASALQDLITSASVKSAETLRAMCRVYEDARFPFEDMKADLAYQVAQSVGGESLWLVARSGSGYRVPLAYNIAVNEAKAVVRELDTTKGELLGVNGEPRVLRTSAHQTVVATPCRDSNDQQTGFLTCVRFEGTVSATTRQIELMCAGAEALVRLVEENELRKAPGEPDDEPAVRHPKGSFKEILTIDSDMIKLIRTAERAATSVAPILFEGETGVGKELFARAIHRASHRKSGPFIALNAGGMSVSLLESELFGHARGAFTDARSERVGLVEAAREGTLFLDEIGEMGEEMQVKLLRLLENGEYRRLGESDLRKADVRIVSATNKNLKDLVEQGRFRGDLYYRLTTLKFTVPPLRMRPNDIPLLVRQFLRECAAMNGIADRQISIDVKAMEALELYNWPGNVRELHNEILRVVSLIGKGDLVRFSMLSDSVKEYLQTAKRGEGLLDRSVDQFERRLLLKAMDRHDWNRMQTADSIGVPRTTLLAKLKRLNVASK